MTLNRFRTPAQARSRGKPTAWQITGLIVRLANALQNHVPGRTAIRDYIINAEDEYYAEVE